MRYLEQRRFVVMRTSLLSGPRRVAGDLRASLGGTFEVGLQWKRAVDYDSFIFLGRIAYGISMRSRPLLFEDFLS